MAAADPRHQSHEDPYLPRHRTAAQERRAHARMRLYYGALWLRRLRRLAGLEHGSPRRVLDVGCGPGYFLAVMAESHPGFHLVGLDIDPKLLEVARRRVPGAKLHAGNAEQLPFEDDSFDLVFCHQVVEHLEHPATFFREARRVLRPGGFMMYSTPNLAGLAPRMLGERWHGFRFDHISLKVPGEWRDLAREADLHTLIEGTTTLTGFRLWQRFPLSLISRAPIAAFGFLPWMLGDSYMAITRLRAPR